MSPDYFIGADPFLRLDSTAAGYQPRLGTWIVQSFGILRTDEAMQIIHFLSQHLPSQSPAPMLLDLAGLLHLPEPITHHAQVEAIPLSVRCLCAVAYVLPDSPALHPVVYRFRNQVEQHIPAQLFTDSQEALVWLSAQCAN